MSEVKRLKNSQKILIIVAVGALLVAALLFSTRTGGGEDIFNEAVEGAELTLTSVGRNYESLAQFTQDNETQARQLLEAARVALENAKARLNSARRINDEYVHGMLDNYQSLANASDVMAQGVDNLLVINENLTNAIYYYSQNNFEKSAEQASYCLKVLTPLLRDFEASNTTLSRINFVFIPSGQRDRLTIAVTQFRNETKIYNQYVRLLQSLLDGKDYLQKNAALEEYLRQMQNAIANGDYQTAQEILQRISGLLQSMRDPRCQSAADLASQLDPNSLGGAASDVAQELRNRLRNLEDINALESYLQSLERYLEALRSLQKGDKEGAEQAANEGLQILNQGQGQGSGQGPGVGGNTDLQGLYAGLRQAFNTLKQNIRNPPPPG